MPQATLLVVDDEPLNVSLLSQLLRPEFRVLGALSGQSALALMAAERPDLVLLDVMMPVMDGLTVLGRMQADPALADIPVIFVTALGAEFDEEKAWRWARPTTSSSPSSRRCCWRGCAPIWRCGRPGSAWPTRTPGSNTNWRAASVTACWRRT